MNFLYYKQNNSDFIIKEYGVDAKNIEENFVDNSILFLPHTLSIQEYQYVFNLYKNYKILFVLDFSYEPYTTLDIVSNFFKAYKLSGISHDRFLMLYNNLYQEGLNSYFYGDNIINTLSFPRWYYEYGMYLDQYPTDRYQYCEYDFSCFNFQGREHKKQSLMYIDRNELNCLATYVHNYDFNSPSVREFDSKDDPSVIVELPLSVYYSGKINICTETLYYKETQGWSDIICITEKIFRNLYFRVPFTVVGNRYTLGALRRIGFKTFNSLIDESYDYQIDAYRYKESIHAANNLLEHWNSSELDDILDYNREYFENKKNTDRHFLINIYDNLKLMLDNIKLNII